MPIKLAADAIRDAELLIAAFDREIAGTAKMLRATKKGAPLVAHLRGEISRLHCERARAHEDLQDLLELVDMPPECMPWA
jgi:hypothetical protein